MHIFKTASDVPPDYRDAIITIGNFDGIHLGHQVIIRNVVEEAHKNNIKAIVITFDPHPKMVLHPERRPFYLINTIDEKIRILKQLNVDATILFTFTEDFSKISAESFVTDILWEQLHVRKILIGHDYTFGRNKQGNETFLKTYGDKLGFSVRSCNAIKVDEFVVSSTLIRRLILEGNVNIARVLLGRRYNLKGKVISGHRRGVSLGFPTYNLKPEKVLIPESGVYAVTARLHEHEYDGVLNIGVNPTFDDEQLSIELNFFDFEHDIYGDELEVLFIERILSRPEALSIQREEFLRNCTSRINQSKKKIIASI